MPFWLKGVVGVRADIGGSEVGDDTNPNPKPNHGIDSDAMI